MNLERPFRQLARHIDDIWSQISKEERAEYNEIMSWLGMCNPEFQEIWYEETTKAARNRLMEGANA